MPHYLFRAFGLAADYWLSSDIFITHWPLADIIVTDFSRSQALHCPADAKRAASSPSLRSRFLRSYSQLSELSSHFRRILRKQRLSPGCQPPLISAAIITPDY